MLLLKLQLETMRKVVMNQKQQLKKMKERKKAPAFDRTEFKWTITNRKPKNLPQLFHGMKGINTLHEVKEAS